MRSTPLCLSKTESALAPCTRRGFRFAKWLDGWTEVPVPLPEPCRGLSAHRLTAMLAGPPHLTPSGVGRPPPRSARMKNQAISLGCPRESVSHVFPQNQSLPGYGTSNPKGFRDASLIKPFILGLIGVAKRAGRGISIDGEGIKVDTALECIQFECLEATLGLKVYVGHPCAEWVCGTNENTVGCCGIFSEGEKKFGVIH